MKKNQPATFRQAYDILQQHAHTLRDQDEPAIDDLLTIVEESVAAYKICQQQITAVEQALQQALTDMDANLPGNAASPASAPAPQPASPKPRAKASAKTTKKPAADTPPVEPPDSLEFAPPHASAEDSPPPQGGFDSFSDDDIPF